MPTWSQWGQKSEVETSDKNWDVTGHLKRKGPKICPSRSKGAQIGLFQLIYWLHVFGLMAHPSIYWVTLHFPSSLTAYCRIRETRPLSSCPAEWPAAGKRNSNRPRNRHWPRHTPGGIHLQVNELGDIKSQGKAELCAFLSYCIVENTQLSPSLIQKPSICLHACHTWKFYNTGCPSKSQCWFVFCQNVESVYRVGILWDKLLMYYVHQKSGVWGWCRAACAKGSTRKTSNPRNLTGRVYTVGQPVIG